MNKRLFILVEGGDDVRFFGRIVKPFFFYRQLQVRGNYPVCMHETGEGEKFLKSVTLMHNDYIFVSDIDFEHSVRDKKQVLYHRFSEVDGGSIVIVVMEIESWYLAGLPPDAAQRMGLFPDDSTDDPTKEDFNRIIPRQFDSRIDFMFEILKFFSFDRAAEKNRSFHYFIHRYHVNKYGT